MKSFHTSARAKPLSLLKQRQNKLKRPFIAAWHSCLIFCAMLTLVACNNSPSSTPNATNNNNNEIDDEPTAVEVRTGPFKALIYSRTAGFRHASIEAGIAAIEQLGAENDFSVDATEDPNQFEFANLINYELVIFLNTTLDVLNTAQEAAFESYIRAGGNFVGIHSAADTEHDWPFYGELVGAYFLTHPVANQPGTVIIEDSEHPSVDHLPEPWAIPLEEFYTFDRSPRAEVRVLARMDESSYNQQPNISCDPRAPDFPNGFDGSMGDHPMVWCHDKFAGRAWYTAFGHEIYLYQQADFLALLRDGILTATRRVAAQCAVLPPPENLPAERQAELEPCQNQLMP